MAGLRKRIWYCAKVIRNVLLFLLIVTIAFIYRIKSIENEKISNVISKAGMERLFVESNNSVLNLNSSEIENTILTHNREQKIFNEDTFGSVMKDTPIIVIFVHKTSAALQFMLLSLSQVKGIQDVLLIFSHSYYDEHANSIIRSIDFCRVLQIYYPYSLQLYRTKFPGHEPGDCPYYLNIKVAEYLNCTGVNSWDIHGHYRNPQLSEKKHHWWWTANQVFENLTCTEGHNGLVIFLGDNYYLMEDFLYMTLFMKRIANSLYRCEFLSLAATSLIQSSYEGQEVKVMHWDPALHSGALAFDLPVWNSIVSHYDLFCFIDDNSWAQSLSYLSLNRRDEGRYRVMTSVLPRAFKPETCLYFGQFFDCDLFAGIYQILDLQKRLQETLFPPNLEVYIEIEMNDEYLSFDYAESNGGWNDPRDKALCVNMTVSKIKKEILGMNNQFEDFTGY